MVWARVIIVNFNGGDLITRMLAGLARQSMTDFEAVIVDNASTDGSANGLILPDSRFRLIRAGTNLGFAAGNNLGARGCKAPWIATLNPDAVPRPDWLENLRHATERYPDVGSFGSTQLLGQDGGTIDGFGDVLSVYGIPWRSGHGMPVSELPAHDAEVFAPCACAALYRRDLFVALGGFDERFFCYIEDLDLGFRLRLRGERCMQVRDAMVYHDASAITGRYSPFTLYHSYRNRIWMLAKNIPLVILPAVLALHLASILYLLARTWPAPGALRGVAAGLGGLGSMLRRRPAECRLSLIQLARMLVWSPSRMRRREFHFVGGDAGKGAR